jgi:hypothetical protein
MSTTSYKAEVMVCGEPGSWHSNALRFATRQDAERYVLDLAGRWTAVVETRVIECDDPVYDPYPVCHRPRVVESDDPVT